MKDLDIIKECISYKEEKEWFEFKENWFSKNEIGEYMSALSNSAAIQGREEAYMIWGINDVNHKIVGTRIDFDKTIDGEPYKHYLARKLNPSINFVISEEMVEGKRIVLLKISAAKVVPTSFDGIRYIRIGSSKERIDKFPSLESELFSHLTFGIPTIQNVESDYQDLSFQQIRDYYSSHNIKINKKNFEINLGLKNRSEKYNILGQLLSDNSYIPIRFAIFSGKTKASKLYSVKEFGYKCLIYSLNEVLEYGKVLNIPQADENNRTMERKEISLFDYDAFREAMINAFLHNKWIEKNEPMITMFSDRIEIFSRGGLVPLQTLDGFFKGHSIPVNEKLSEIFLQLHISEKTGRGVPVILNAYGKKAFCFSNDGLTVVIPFNRKSNIGDKVGDKVGDKMGDKVGDKIKLTTSQIKVLAEIRNNSNITKPELCIACSLSKTSIDNAISCLRKNNYITRVGSNKTGHWEVIE